MTGANVSRMARAGSAGCRFANVVLWGIPVGRPSSSLVDTFSLYRQALAAADTAYDRTLLASAVDREQLEVVDVRPPRVEAVVPYSALEAFGRTATAACSTRSAASPAR